MVAQHTESTPTASQLIELNRYPIGDINEPAGNAFAEKCRTEYQQTGLCMLPGFIRPQALDALANEAESLRNNAYFCKSTHDAYLNEEESDSGQREQTFVGSVPYDLIPVNSQLNTLYQWDPLKNFIGFVLGKDSFYRFADPFGACSINVFVDGGEHGWHFDESEFTVTLMLQKPDQGGAFEYAPRIRGLTNEQDLVANILKGSRERVMELPFTAGTLLIFGGNQTLHRVTRVTGNRARLVPVLCYSERPNDVNSEAVRKLFWGRSGPQETPLQ